MKQQALHKFSAAAIKGGFLHISRLLALLFLIYSVYIAFLFAGAWFLCRYALSFTNILIWCGARLLLKAAVVLLTVSGRAAIIRRCTVRMLLPCGYEKSIHKRLRRLYLLRSVMRFLCRLLWIAGFLGALWLLQRASVQPESIYQLMGAVQIIPLSVLLLVLRIRLEISFASAEVLSVRYPEQKAWKSFRESGQMLMGQYGFIMRVFLRCLPELITPGLMPKYIMTFVSYFSVRHMEWRYEQREEEKLQNEQSHIHRPHRKPYEAGDVSAT